MNPLTNFDKRTDDFWEVNPGFKLPFKELFTNDKSKGKEKSSKIMWVLAFICEVENNPYSDVLESDKKDIILSEMNLEDSKQLDKWIEAYKTLRLSYLQRKLDAWKLKLDERDQFIADTTYNVSSYEMLDKLMGTTEKLYKQYFSILSELDKDKGNRELGGGQSSLSDKGDI